MGTVLYFFKEAIRGFYQAKLMTFVAIISIAVSLCFMNLIAITFFNIEKLLKKSSNQTDLVAYLKETYATDETVVDALVMSIQSFPEIRKVELIGKDSAWQRFAALYGKEMLEAIDENPLPVSIEMYLREQSRSQVQIDRLVDTLKTFEVIETVQYSREWIGLIERFRYVFWGTAGIIAIIINFILYFMIANTIKLTIYARKELVAHMQMVGATSFFIKMPFVLEGMLQGVIGGIVCIVALFIVRLLLIGIPVYWGPQPQLLLVTLFLGVLYGWLGSVGAVRKFLA